MKDKQRYGRPDQPGHSQPAPRPAPGKRTLTSQLPVGGSSAVQRKAGSFGAAGPALSGRPAEHTLDVWAPPGARGDDTVAVGSAPGAGGQSGTIDRIGPGPDEAIARGAGEGLEDLPIRGDGGTPTPPGSAGGATPAPSPPPSLSVTTAITSGYDQPNTLSVSPFGEMIPSFEFTNIAWTVSGRTCNITARLACHYPWGINGGGRADVPSGTDAVVTAAAHPSSGKKVWETIVDDLTPGGSTPFKSRRTWYWSQALTARHERFHGTDDYAWVTSTGQPDAQAFLQSRTVSSTNTAADVRDALERARRRIAQGSDAYYGVSLAHDSRPGEIRAYAEGRPSYQALADAVAVRGRALAAPAPGTGGTGGAGGTPDTSGAGTPGTGGAGGTPGTGGAGGSGTTP